MVPAQSVEAKATLSLTQEHIDGGLVESSVTAEGTPPAAYNPVDPDNPIEPDPVTDGSTEIVPLDPAAHIELVKTGVVDAETDTPGDSG